MKVESRTYLGFMAFFAVIGLLYWFTAYEDAGSILLGAAALLSLLLGGYLFVLSRWIPSRTQDDPRASIADGAGTVGEFPAPTVWPFVFGFGATVLATGTVFGVYVVVAGLLVLGIALVGMVRQSRGAPPLQEEGAEEDAEDAEDAAGSSSSV